MRKIELRFNMKVAVLIISSLMIFAIYNDIIRLKG